MSNLGLYSPKRNGTLGRSLLPEETPISFVASPPIHPLGLVLLWQIYRPSRVQFIPLADTKSHNAPNKTSFPSPKKSSLWNIPMFVEMMSAASLYTPRIKGCSAVATANPPATISPSDGFLQTALHNMQPYPPKFSPSKAPLWSKKPQQNHNLIFPKTSSLSELYH